MARTLAEIIEISRSLLQDQRSPYRYGDLELCRYIGEAVAETRRLRPDLFVYEFDDPLPLYTAGNLQAFVPLPEFMFAKLVDYVVGRAELRDDSYTNDGRAATLLTWWQNAVRGK